MTPEPALIGGAAGGPPRVLGEPGEQLRRAHRIAVASAVVLFIGTTVLIGTHVAYLWEAGAEKTRVAELEGRTKGDPEVAGQLHDERKRQTDDSLARETRSRVLAWVLLVAGGVFVASGKWYVSLRPQRLPSLEDLVAVRLGGMGGPEARMQGAGGKQAAEAQGVEAAGARGEGEANGAAETDGPGSHFDREFVDGLIDRFGRDKESAIPILQAIQGHYRYLPDEALRQVCEKTEITPAQIAGTSTFYAQFRRTPVGRHVVRVCHGTACHVAGAEQITEELRRHLEIPPDGDTDPRSEFTVDKVACLGCCSLAPVMMIEEETAGRLTPASARRALDAVAKGT